ncbi:hypothetical protein RchiOBHm_Chr7g0185961 [Rosa chinensis]|uniref:Uncharacterized protein n=1 Tax=Rosa chinensis TaxID=74649 RepID=A0A2P6P3U1_ROSCH|nr:hypothetical protein RchiOBHm_Chr7g0185961 [Rosa chinensis]
MILYYFVLRNSGGLSPAGYEITNFTPFCSNLRLAIDYRYKTPRTAAAPFFCFPLSRSPLFCLPKKENSLFNSETLSNSSLIWSLKLVWARANLVPKLGESFKREREIEIDCLRDKVWIHILLLDLNAFDLREGLIFCEFDKETVSSSGSSDANMFDPVLQKEFPENDQSQFITSQIHTFFCWFRFMECTCIFKYMDIIKAHHNRGSISYILE